MITVHISKDNNTITVVILFDIAYDIDCNMDEQVYL